MNTEKICRVCQRIKKLHDFSLAPGNKDGYSHRCKECVATHAKQYYKTLPGLITHIYNTELSSSKARKHPKPTYSKKELTNWLYEQGILLQYEVWKNSGYLKDLRPSVDRIDSTKPYSLKNI